MTPSPYFHKKSLFHEDKIDANLYNYFYAALTNKSKFIEMADCPVCSPLSSDRLPPPYLPACMLPLCLHICFALLDMLPPPQSIHLDPILEDVVPTPLPQKRLP